ncbi:hypothetical protein ACJBQ0_11605, partial [Streptococcus suis]
KNHKQKPCFNKVSDTYISQTGTITYCSRKLGNFQGLALGYTVFSDKNTIKQTNLEKFLHSNTTLLKRT